MALTKANGCRRLIKGFRSDFNQFSTKQNHILKEETKNIGLITLNRPDIFNTITWTMSSEIYHTLRKWECEKKLVVMKGAGQAAFSAGADLKSIFDGLKNNTVSVQDMSLFMNADVYLLSSYKIPYVALINGITMGGGVGLSINGKYQVASEKTVWAMPETKIGYYPNVGASYFLSRLPEHLGRYLGLTGRSLRGSDVVRAGLASHFSDSSHFEMLEQKLLSCSEPEEVEHVLDEFDETDLPEFSLALVIDKIDYCFSGDSVEEIIARLRRDGSSWAEETIETLMALSPTSLKVSLRQLQNGVHSTMKDCLIMEYRMNNNIMRYKDFHEGIRALIIDKDKRPQWNPPSLSEVPEKLVDAHFVNVPGEEKQIKLLQRFQMFLFQSIAGRFIYITFLHTTSCSFLYGVGNQTIESSQNPSFHIFFFTHRININIFFDISPDKDVQWRQVWRGRRKAFLINLIKISSWRSF